MKKNTFLVTFILTFFIFNNTSYAQTFNWENATDNGSNVSEIKSGITATVTGSFSGINLIAANGLGDTSGNVVVNEFTNENTSATISFSSPQNVATINALDGELTGLTMWTFTPVPLGANTAKTITINGAVTTVVLNFTSVTSVVVTSSQMPGNKDTFAFDDIVLGSGTAAPSILTSSATPISANTTTLNGNVTSNGGDAITERGFVYALTSDDSTPTLAETANATVTKVTVTGTTGEFNQEIANLIASSEYSYIAYAINNTGTKEGATQTFSTISNTENCLVTNPFDDSNFNNGALHFGQSFVACQSGKLKSIALLVAAGQTNTAATINVYSGTVINTANLLGSLTAQELTENGGDTTNFDVTDFSAQNINLTAGQTYTFDIPTISNLIYTNDNGYSNGEIYVDSAANGGNYDLVFNINIVSTSISWTGAISNVWSLPANWSTGILPDANSKITIPSGLTNYPTASVPVTFNSLTINSGATFIPESTVTGSVTYKRNLPTTNWYLVSSPVSGETFENLISNHTFASGTGANIGMSAYSTSSGSWIYTTIAVTGIYPSGLGLSMKLAAPSDISFTGTANTSNTTFPISTANQNGYNLLGNPYTSYINSNIFTGDNSTLLTEETVWLWNGTSYDTYNSVSPIEIAPGQAFFVESSVTSSNVTFNTNNQSHQSSDTFMKQAPKTSFELLAEDNNEKKSTKVFYIENKTTGFDNGYDGSLFDGVSNSFEIYTQLVSNNTGQNLAIQTLPSNNYQEMIIPVGIKAEPGKTITFSLKKTNFNSDLKIYLEDRLTNTFTRLDQDSNNYKITLSKNLDGIGRFYIHTTESALSVDRNTTLKNTSIYKLNNTTLRITGLPQGDSNTSIYNMLGKQVLQTSFTSNGIKDIALPYLSKGVYLVKLETENGKLNKKIVLE